MISCFTATPGVDVITTTADIPTLGSLAINAFVMHGAEPVLVDTGTVAGGAEFMTALASVIDPSELRWIWLTHTDFDHIGSLATLLDANPNLRVITSFLGVGHHGPVLDAAADGPRPSRQPRPVGHGRRPPTHRGQAARVRQPDHHRLRRRPHRDPVQLRLLRRAAACSPRHRRRPRSRRAPQGPDSLGDDRLVPGCTTSTATSSATRSRSSAPSSRPWCAAAISHPHPAPCSTTSSIRWP